MPSCDPALCAEADPCLEGRCEGSLCVRVRLSGTPCDDGVFCNGADSCLDGACSAHAGDPCGGCECVEAGRACLECRVDTDCGMPAPGGWSACSFNGECDESGERSRSVTVPRCVAGACTTTTETEREGCGRSTSGNACEGGRTFGAWSECDYDGVCDEAATRTREVVDRRCSGGRCVASSTFEDEPCTRSTTGQVCADGGTYCGRELDCYVCRSGACVVNTPHYDAFCRPSCGVAASLCGGPAICCSFSTSCVTVGPGGWADCARCCARTFC